MIAESMDRLKAVDGLRAVAVLLVVLFHTFPPLAPGGFIGVDVFFVISGFVIARRYLLGEWVGASEFFARRIRRLVPAYLVMIAVVAVVAYFTLLPRDLYNFGKSLAAQAVYLQNVAFWIEGTYFEPAQVKPLLHTWSLAVEEQFYLLFPLLVVAWRRGWGAGLLLLAAALSLALGFVLASESPKTAFFLLPTRVWEFAAGIGAAYACGRVQPVSGVSVTGLALILVAALLFGEASSFPGPQALLAVAGAALVCVYQTGGGLLATAPAQHFGRISYSFYLWHWPPVVFFFAMTGRMPGVVEGLGCIAVGYALGWASWRWVEGWRPKNVRPLLASFIMFAGVGGAALYATKGALDRYPPNERVRYAAQLEGAPARCSYRERLVTIGQELCRLNEAAGAGLLVVGDSHAAVVAPMIASLGAQAGRAVHLVKTDCSALSCPDALMTSALAEAKAAGVTDIMLIAYWPPAAKLDDFRRAIGRVAGFRVHLVKAVPSSPFFDPIAGGRGSFTRADYDRVYAAQNSAFAQLHSVHVLDPVPIICPNRCRFAVSGLPLYFDTNHLTTAGVATLRPMFGSVFN